ncbi:MAG: hypothetical protein ACOC32_04900 [Nanoarchaeota archaeon]
MNFLQDRFTTNFGLIPYEVLQESPQYMKNHPLYLFVPATYGDATSGEVAENIFSTIQALQDRTESIDHIVLGLDAAEEQKQFEEIRERFKQIPNSTVIWNSAPEMLRLYEEFKEQEIPVSPGKGRNMWTGLGYRYMINRGSSFVIHDCDIKPKHYTEDTLLSLITPILHPEFGEQDFNKAYYRRITPHDKNDPDSQLKLSGRVTRLLVSPFLDAVHENYGDISKTVLDYVDFLKAFKYPLSGEFAMRANLANTLEIQPDWGLEIGTLNSLFQRRSHLSQVDLGDYDHKHQDVEKNDPKKGLNRMAEDIVKTVFRKLYSLAEEESMDQEAYMYLMKDFQKFADQAIDDYKLYSKSRKFYFDEVAEIEAKHVFHDAIERAYRRFISQPEEVRPLPNWNQIPHKQRQELVDIIEYYNRD